jgi:DNA polymerase-1
MTPKDESLLILDVQGLVIRSASLADTENGITDAKGKQHANWKSGLTSFLTKELLPILENMPPRRIIAVWDAGNEYRTGFYPAYKQRRKQVRADELPEIGQERKALFDETQRFLAYLGVKNVWVKGQEADDVIALFCEKLSPTRQLLIKTIDADLLQLAGPNVNVFYQDQIYSAGDTYRAKSGDIVNEVPVDLIRLYKAIVGDSSDGYSGVRGAGPRAWSNMLAAYETDGMQQIEAGVKTGQWGALEGAYQATQDKNLATLLERREEFAMSYQLASLHPKVCYSSRNGQVVKPSWKVRVPSREKISWYLQEIGAMDLMTALDRHLPIQTLYTLDNHDKLAEEMVVLQASQTVAYDFESYDTGCHQPYQAAASNKNFVDVLSQSLTGVSWCYGDNYQKVGYASFNHADTDNFPKPWQTYVLQCISQVAEQVVQNANFELTVAKQDLGLDMPAPCDTAIMASYVDENLESNLKGMSKHWFGYAQQTYQEVTDGKTMNELSAAHVMSYGCDDSLVSAHLFDLFRVIMQLEGSWEFYQENEILHAKDNVDSFIWGTRIDIPYLADLRKADAKLVKSATKKVRKSLQDHAMQKSQEQTTEDATRLLGLYWETAAIKQAELSDERVVRQYEALRNADAGLKRGEASAPETELTIPLLQTTEEIRTFMLTRAYTELWKKSWVGSGYVPYVEETQQADFVPSPTNLTKVLKALGSNQTLAKTSKAAINEFMFDTETEDADNLEVQKFLALLGAASHRLTPKKRSGPEYDALAEFCAPILAGAGGVKVVSSGDALNFGSPDQMQQLLYGKLSLPVRRRSKVAVGSFRDLHELPGSAATGNKAVLSALVYDVEDGKDWRFSVLHHYLAISKAQQNESLYYKKYPLWVSPADGMIHPQIKNCGTVTRRPSGTAPNVLQVSSKDDAKIRKSFLPWGEEYVWACLDFNGQELRLTASESRDPAMMEAYLGKDPVGPHTVTAGRLANILLPRMGYPEMTQEITYQKYKELMAGGDEKLVKALKEVRNRYAKATNFTVTYGGGAFTLAENLIIPMDLAESIMDSIMRLYARIQPWQNEVAEFARRHGYVETAYGNRRHVPNNIHSNDPRLRRRTERQACNMLAQGCAADILKIVLSTVARRKLVEKYKLRSIMPIYDELAVCVPKAAVADYSLEMAEIMAVTPPGHPIPMEAELEIGVKSWGDKKGVALDHAAITEFLNNGEEK